MKIKPPKRIEMDIGELNTIVAHTRTAALSTDEREKLAAAVETLAYLTQALEHKGTSLERIRRLLFGPSTEKTADVLAAATAAGEQEQKHEPAGKDVPGAPGAGTDTPPAEPKEKRPGHGRNGAAAYTGAEKVSVPYESLQAGDPCPACESGKVYPMAEPAQLVRVKGQAPLMATVYECARMRCNLCGEVFTAAAPDGVGPDKYDASAGGMIALLKYGCGMPFNRLKRLEGGVGIPLPAATQWDIVKAVAAKLAPAYGELIRQAAQGEVLHNDDTTAKVLSLMAKARAGPGGALDVDEEKADPERTGVFTSGIVSIHGEQKIALFFTGRSHAGENLAAVLKERAAELMPPIQMCDALSRNVTDHGEDLGTVIANCLTHSRRKFVEVATRFPPEVRYVLETLREVYRTDARTRELKMTPIRRLSYHKRHSGPVMRELERWLAAQFAEKKVEPNSGLGEAIIYMQKHWEKLTLFLRVPGAPLDNNVCERALKKAILHRKNALFFKTENGAQVGDLFMSLIHTAELMKVDAFDYLVALQEHAAELAEDPDEWLPWNYQVTLARIAAP